MATQLANAYVQIIPSAEGIKGKIASAMGAEAEEAGEKAGKIAGNSLGGALKKVVGAAGIGAAAVGTAIGAMTKQAMSAYADYEQLTGGVETLFNKTDLSLQDYAASIGKSVEDTWDEWASLTAGSRIVMNNADEAFRTCGLSANEYMNTVTSFSAAMIASLDGDTKEAAKKSNMAIVDMADNANKMGSTMESIQNAYNGFAKQNYTMLDNLKLGYGGTQKEMERLLKDAGKLAGTKYDISSYADIVEAIHVIQDEMGIAGATEEEAATTIQGSLGMLKGAWNNLLTGMADSEQDFGLLIDNLIESVITVSNNIAPRLVDTIPRVVEGLVELTQNLIPHIGPIIKELLPTLVKGTADLIVSLIKNIPSMLSDVGGILVDAFKTIWELLPESAQGKITKLAGAFAPLWSALQNAWNNIGKPVFDAVMNTIEEVAEWTDTHFDEICAGINGALTFIQDKWNEIGKPLFDLIVEIVTLTKEAFEEKFGSMSDVVGNVFSEISGFWNEHLRPCFDAIGKWLTEVLFPIFSFVFEESILPMIKDCFEGIGRFWDNTLKPILTGIIDFITGVFSGDWDKAFSGLMNVAEGLLNGLIDIFTTPFDKVKRIVNNAIETIKGYFKFEWSLPQLKLPHFKVSGGEAPWGFGGKGSLPSVGIDWYSKAMNNPMLMNSPTAFGINSLGQIMAGGESGSEVVSGTETLMKMIAAAVASQNGNLVELMDEGMDKIIALLRYLPQLANMQIVTDTGTLIGELAPGMDEALGKMAEG